MILVRAQRLVRLRDNGKNCYMKALYPVRRSYALFGERWARQGWLDKPDDIFFLTISEVQRIVESRDPTTVWLDVMRIVDKRRNAFEY